MITNEMIIKMKKNLSKISIDKSVGKFPKKFKNVKNKIQFNKLG